MRLIKLFAIFFVIVSSFFSIAVAAAIAGHESYFDKKCLMEQSYPERAHPLLMTCNDAFCYIYPKTLETIVLMRSRKVQYRAVQTLLACQVNAKQLAGFVDYNLSNEGLKAKD
jgi:hypothetical protein